MSNGLKQVTLIIGSIALAAVTVEASLRILGWATLRHQTSGSAPAKRPADFVAIAIGESTTQGTGGVNPDGNYPNILEKILRSRCPGRSIRVENLGIAGMNTRDIAQTLPSQLERYQPDLVITMMGINDPAMAPNDVHQSMAAVATPTPFRVVRLYHWLRVSLKSLLSKEPHGVSSETPDEILKMIRDGKIIDGQKFAIHFSQPLLNIDRKLSLAMHEKVLAIQPNHAWALLEMGNLHREHNVEKAIGYHRRAIESMRNPHLDRHWFLVSLAIDYASAGRWSNVRSIELDLMKTWNSRTAMQIADLYIRRGKIREAHRHLTGFLERHPGDPVILGTVTALSKQSGMPPFKDAQDPAELPIFEHFEFTKRNYFRILDLIRSAKSDALIMQYPTRSLSLIEKMLQKYPPGRWSTLSHQRTFAAAVKKHGYANIFTDYLGGTFGHLTPLGNSILAQNAADFLLAKSDKLRAICKE